MRMMYFSIFLLGTCSGCTYFLKQKEDSTQHLWQTNTYAEIEARRLCQ